MGCKHQTVNVHFMEVSLIIRGEMRILMFPLLFTKIMLRFFCDKQTSSEIL